MGSAGHNLHSRRGRHLQALLLDGLDRDLRQKYLQRLLQQDVTPDKALDDGAWRLPPGESPAP